MTPISARQLRELMSHECPGSVSILMPTFKAGPDAQQNPVRLRNLLSQAEAELAELGLRRATARQRLAEVAAGLDDEFWRRQGQGLAIYFCNGDETVRKLRLAQTVEELVVVGEHYHVAPIISAAGRELFYVLVLGQKRARLLQASEHAIHEMVLYDTPTNIDELLTFIEEQKNIQVHTRSAPHGPGGTQREKMAHGQGSNGDEGEMKKRLLEFCKMIDTGVHRHLRESQLPLLLAGSEPLTSIYRAASTYGYVYERTLSGNYEKPGSGDLHAKALEVMSPYLQQGLSLAREKFERAEGNGRTVGGVKYLLPRAWAGQIEMLFLAAGEHLWGRYDAINDASEVHPRRGAGDEDLLNLLAVKVGSTGAEVLVADRDSIPGQEQAAAALRFVTAAGERPITQRAEAV